MKCRFADFNVEIKSNYDYLRLSCNDYMTDFDNPDFYIEIVPDYLKTEFEKSPVVSDEPRFEAVLAYRMLADKLPSNGAFVLHSAVCDIDGVGVAFAAHSGTGKTTHLRLLRRLLGDRLTVINGDKPIVRFFDGNNGGIFAYGTPWNGKEHYGCNKRTSLKHICFISRSETNFVEPMDKDEAIARIFNQVYMPSEPAQAAATIALVDRLFTECTLWHIHCNMELDAAKHTYNALFGEGK